MERQGDIKKFLVLGVGNAQVDLLAYLKDSGNFEVHALAYDETAPGIQYCDHYRKINITDMEEVYRYAKDAQIDYIYSVGSDIAMPTVFAVSKRLNLPYFVMQETADLLNNKYKMRKTLSKSEVIRQYMPRFFEASSLEDLKDRKSDFEDLNAWIIKPVDSQGQRGVAKVSSFKELQKQFPISLEHSRSKKTIVEEYIDGQEYSINAYIIDSNVVFCLPSFREVYQEYPGGIIKRHVLSASLPNSASGKALIDMTNDLVRELEIENGPLYIQLKIDSQTGKIVIIEAAARFDGCHMHHIIREYTKVNLLDLVVKHLTGNLEAAKTSSDICKLLQKSISDSSRSSMTLEFYGHAPNQVFKSSDYLAGNEFYSKFYYTDQETVKPINGFVEKVGYKLYYEPQKVAVIGGSGLIGTWLIAALESSGIQVSDVSRSSGTVSSYSKDELLTSLRKVHAIVILAAKKVNQNEEQSLEIYQDNVDVVKNTLFAAKKLGIKNIVFTSSRLVYATEAPVPFTENSPIAPRNFYGEAKLLGEDLVQQFNAQNSGFGKILRLSQVLAPGDTAGYMVSKFIKNALTGIALSIFGRAKGMRDYIYVKDVAQGIICALKRYDTIGIFNIGSGTGSTNLDIANAVLQAYNSSSKIDLLEDKPEDESITILDIKKATTMLQFTPKFTLDQAFADMKGND